MEEKTANRDSKLDENNIGRQIVMTERKEGDGNLLSRRGGRSVTTPPPTLPSTPHISNDFVIIVPVVRRYQHRFSNSNIHICDGKYISHPDGLLTSSHKRDKEKKIQIEKKREEVIQCSPQGMCLSYEMPIFSLMTPKLLGLPY